MGAKIGQGFQRPNAILGELGSDAQPFAEGRVIVIHSVFRVCGERNTGGRENERRDTEAVPNLLRISEALSGSKLLYSEMEKMAYAVVMAARKLRHYF